MIDEIKEVLQMILSSGENIAQTGLWFILAIGVYKLATLASVLMLIKYIVTKLYDFGAIKRIEPTGYKIRNADLYVGDEDLFKSISAIVKKLTNYDNKDNNWLHSDQQKLILDILTKEYEKRKLNV